MTYIRITNWVLQTAAEWTASLQVLHTWEAGVESDTGKVKRGNGLDVYSALSYLPGFGSPGGGGDMLAANNLSDVANLQTSRQNLFPSFAGNTGKFLKVNALEDDVEFAALAGGGDMLSSNNLSDVVSPSTSRTNLGATTVGANLFTVPDPSAIRFIRIDAANTVTLRNAGNFLSDIGGQPAGSYLTAESDPVFTSWYNGGAPLLLQVQGSLGDAYLDMSNADMRLITGVGDYVWLTNGVGNFSAKLDMTLLTADRLFQFPDQPGTFALTSDLSSFITSESDPVFTTWLGTNDYLSSFTSSTQVGYFGGIKLKDQINPSHYLNITCEDDLTNNRNLQINVADGNKVLTINGNVTALSGSHSGTSSGTNTGDDAVNSLYSGLDAAKVPYIGATGDVDLGTFYLSTASIGIGFAPGTELFHAYQASGIAEMVLDADGGNDRRFFFRTTDVNRWSLVVTDDSEIGGNIGSDFKIKRYSDAGAFIDNPIAIRRDNGNVGFANDISANNFSGTSSGANTGDQTSVSGNAGTATALQTSRNLWGQSFDGTGNVTGSLTSVGDITGGASNMIIQSGTGASRTLTFKTTTAGSVATTALTLAADQSATFANTVNATTFVGALTGNASTASSAAVLTTPRTIGGVSFDGSGNIVPQTIQSVNEATDTTCFPLFISASGSQSLQPLNNAGFIYNSNANSLTATTFIGALTGNSTTATSAATLTNARLINGTSFNGSADITLTLLPNTASTSTSVTFTSSDYGKVFLWSPGGTATATLPANGATAGSWFDVLLLTAQTITISSATVDTLITLNDTQADSVAFSTAGSKIGALVRFISNGSFWVAINLSNHTMTVAT